MSPVDAVAALASVCGEGLDLAPLAVLRPALDHWDRDPLPRRPTLGPAGVLVSTHLRRDGETVAQLRCEVDPPWTLEDPRSVHGLVAALGAAAGIPGDLPAASALLSSSAWPPPGVGPGPYVGIAVSAGRPPSVRVWSPRTGPVRPLTEVLALSEAEPPPPGALPTFAGTEVSCEGIAKLSLYFDGSPAPPPAPLAAVLRVARDHDPRARISSALRWDVRDQRWQPVVELSTREVPDTAVARCLEACGWTAAAEMVMAVAATGLELAVLSSVGRGETEWLAAYWTPRLRALATGRAVHIHGSLVEAVGIPDRPGARAQSIVDWRGLVHTACWDADTEPLRWRTISDG